MIWNILKWLLRIIDDSYFGWFTNVKSKKQPAYIGMQVILMLQIMKEKECYIVSE